MQQAITSCLDTITGPKCGSDPLKQISHVAGQLLLSGCYDPVQNAAQTHFCCPNMQQAIPTCPDTITCPTYGFDPLTLI